MRVIIFNTEMIDDTAMLNNFQKITHRNFKTPHVRRDRTVNSKNAPVQAVQFFFFY